MTHVEIFITLTYSVIACSGCVLFRDKRVGRGVAMLQLNVRGEREINFPRTRCGLCYGVNEPLPLKTICSEWLRDVSFCAHVIRMR